MLLSGSRVTRVAGYVGIALLIFLGYHAWTAGYLAPPPPSRESFYSETKLMRPEVGFPEPIKLTAGESLAEDPKANQYVPPPPVVNITASPCESITGGEDVVVVMRTGATEIRDKLPVHFQTTFKCYHHLLIFSDYAETVEGHQVFDVLAEMDERVKDEHEDFDHYKHINQVGTEGLEMAELSGQVSVESGGLGKGDNAGWRLDKWKFLPMMEQTLRHRPDHQWYVFVEPDSYLVYSNLVQWLPALDASKPHYIGSPVQIGDDVFAHGGSVFVLSNPALRAVVDEYNSRKSHWHHVTGEQWAGDCVLGIALREAGVDLRWGSPMFQGGNPATMDWGDRTFWCSPVMSYHHLNPLEKLRMFNLEQDWIRNQHSLRHKPALLAQDDDTVLRHSDVCKNFLLPQIRAAKKLGWNNDVEHEQEEYTVDASLDGCQDLCEKAKGCLQYAVTPSGCILSEEPKLGRPQPGADSGWLLNRIDAWISKREREGCSGAGGWQGIPEDE